MGPFPWSLASQNLGVLLVILNDAFPDDSIWNHAPPPSREGDNRGRDGWMASLTQWTWVWANSGRWWRTGKPDVLQSMESQRVGYNWATSLSFSNWTTTSREGWLLEGKFPLLPFLFLQSSEHWPGHCATETPRVIGQALEIINTLTSQSHVCLPRYVPGWVARLFVTFSGRLAGCWEARDWSCRCWTELALIPGPAVALHSTQATHFCFSSILELSPVLPAMCISHRNDFKPGLCMCRDCLFAGEYFMRSFPTCCFRAVPLR